MLGTILKRTLVWSLPLATAYLFILFVYGPHGKPWLAVAAILFPLFAIIFEAITLYKANLQHQSGKKDARTAEVIGCWSGIIVCLTVLLISWSGFHGGAVGSLVAAGVFGRRLIMSTR